MIIPVGLGIQDGVYEDCGEGRVDPVGVHAAWILSGWTRPSAGLNSPQPSVTDSWIDGEGSRCRGGNAQGLSKGAACWYLIVPQGVGVPDGMEASRSRHGRGAGGWPVDIE